jgi:hypothetical protein
LDLQQKGYECRSVLWTINRPAAVRYFMIGLSAACEACSGVEVRTLLSYSATLIFRAAHLDVHPLEIRYLLGKPPSIVNGTRRHLILGDDPVGDGDPMIVLSKRRSLVDDTRSRGGFDVAVADDSVGSVFEL